MGDKEPKSTDSPKLTKKVVKKVESLKLADENKEEVASGSKSKTSSPATIRKKTTESKKSSADLSENKSVNKGVNENEVEKTSFSEESQQVIERKPSKKKKVPTSQDKSNEVSKVLSSKLKSQLKTKRKLPQLPKAQLTRQSYSKRNLRLNRSPKRKSQLIKLKKLR